MVLADLGLESVAIRAKGPVVRRVVVVPITVDVVHVQLTRVKGHKPAVLTMRLLVRQLPVPVAVYPNGPTHLLARRAQMLVRGNRILTASDTSFQNISGGKFSKLYGIDRARGLASRWVADGTVG